MVLISASLNKPPFPRKDGDIVNRARFTSLYAVVLFIDRRLANCLLTYFSIVIGF